MAKLTANGVTIEGTPEELAAIMKRFSTEVDAVEPEETPVLKAGDFITITFGNGELYDGDITEGKAYEVLSDDGELNFVDDAHDLRVSHIRRGLYTIVDKPEASPFSTGDKVRVNNYGEFGGVDIGEIGTVAEGHADENDAYSVKVEGYDDHDYFRPQDIELITEAEVAKAEADAIERKRSEVFKANGRKVNEYHEGDIVRVIATGSHDYREGDVIELLDIDSQPNSRHISGKSVEYPYVFPSEVEPLVFVENRLDRK